IPYTLMNACLRGTVRTRTMFFREVPARGIRPRSQGGPRSLARRTTRPVNPGHSVADQFLDAVDRGGCGPARHRTLAVRYHHRLPLPDGSADDRTVHFGRG